MADETDTPIDPATPDPGALADPPPADPALAADPADAPPPPVEPPARRGVADNPLLGTLAELRARDAQRETEMTKLRQENADARALAERLSRGDVKDREIPPEIIKRWDADRRAPPASDDAEVDRRAAERVFQRDVAAVSATGSREFGAEWQKTISGLNAVGIDNNFLAQVIDVDKEQAYAILHDLGQDLERAVHLAKLTPHAKDCGVHPNGRRQEQESRPPARA